MLAARLCLPGARFAAPPLDMVGADTPLQKRAGALCRVVLGTGTAVLHFQGNALSGPGKLRPAFEYVAARAEPFTATDLPGDLDECERRLLARRLVREGLLQHADGAQGGT